MPFKVDPNSVVPVEVQKEVFLEMTAQLRVSQWDQDNLEEYAIEHLVDELRMMSEEVLDAFVAETMNGTRSDK